MNKETAPQGAVFVLGLSVEVFRLTPDLIQVGSKDKGGEARFSAGEGSDFAEFLGQVACVRA